MGKYAMMELELMVLQWANEKCCMYLMGMLIAFTTIIDHKPLVSIVNGQNLDAYSTPGSSKSQLQLAKKRNTRL